MKTTVSATLLILGALGCAGQYAYWSVGSNRNQNLLAIQPQTYNQPNSPQNYAPANTNVGYAGNGANSNPGLNSYPGPNSVPGPAKPTTKQDIWDTPDPMSTSVPWSSATRPPTGSRPTADYRPNPSVATPGKGAAGSPSNWNLAQPNKVLGLSSTPRPKKGTTKAPPAYAPQELFVVSPTPVPSSDRLVFPVPGGNKPGSTFDSLAVAVEDDAPDSASDINNGLRQFALDILMDVTEAAPDKNVVLSPYSIWAVMLVIYEGASGPTASQIATTLKFNDKKKKVRSNYMRLEAALRLANEESHSDFVSGNGIFYDVNRPLRPEFTGFALSSYQCNLQPVNFANPNSAVATINEWVAEVTKNRIRTLVKADDIEQPELIITNALFFKGQWKIPFNQTATHDAKFYNERKEHIANVRMMYQKGAYMYSFISEIGAHVLDMPYEDTKFRMLVILPKPTSNVREVLRLMKAFPVDQCYRRLVQEQEMFSEDDVHVYLPRFKFGNRVELKSNLKRLGITDVFDSSRANLTLMSPLKAFLAKVFHVSEIEVNEEGTVASAATAAGFVNKMGPPKFLANRPFVYFIVEDSQKTVIFAGKVADPTKKMT